MIQKENLVQIGESAKPYVDALSISTVVATIAGLLPAIAALFTIIWTAIRIYETDTIRAFFKKRAVIRRRSDQ